jgi:hypothetical protein
MVSGKSKKHIILKSHRIMKLIFFYYVYIIYTLSSCSFISKTQRNINIERDTINIAEFDLCQKDMSYSSINTIEFNESNFLLKFINPLSISKVYWEVLDDTTNLYVYNGAEVNFYKDKLEGLEFTNSNYKFILTNGTSIQVGDTISVIRKLFPKSWNWMKYEKYHIFLVVDLIGPKGPLDASLIFNFDPKTKIINKIIFSVDNS